MCTTCTDGEAHVTADVQVAGIVCHSVSLRSAVVAAVVAVCSRALLLHLLLCLTNSVLKNLPQKQKLVVRRMQTHRQTIVITALLLLLPAVGCLGPPPEI